jgi:phosphoglycerol transferase MdoB-like AlkP superfamily enzyme
MGSNPIPGSTRQESDCFPPLKFELEAVRRWIAYLRLFSQVLLMFKPISLAVGYIFGSMRMLISFRIFLFLLWVYTVVYTALQKNSWSELFRLL